MMIYYRREAVWSSTWWKWSLCSRLQSEWVCHDWGLWWQTRSWEGGQVSHHNQSTPPLSIPGMTLKANTWAPFPTWQHLDGRTAAPVFSLATTRRWKVSTCFPIIFLLYFTPGLACGWRLQRWQTIEHRDIPAFKSEMDNEVYSSQVKIVFK